MDPLQLTEKQFVALTTLIRHGVQSGLDLVEASGGELPRGTVYLILTQLEDAGFVNKAKDESRLSRRGRPRSIYTVTGPGERAQQAYAEAQRVQRAVLSGAQGVPA